MQLGKTCLKSAFRAHKIGIFLRYNQHYLQNKYIQALDLNLFPNSLSQLPKINQCFYSFGKSDWGRPDQKVIPSNKQDYKQEEGIELAFTENDKVESNARYRNFAIYNFILKRVIKTCQIYLDSPQEQRNLVKVESRFNYIKKATDQLTLEELEEFRTYLNQIKQYQSFSNFYLNQEDFETLLGGEDKNGTIMRSLYIDFVRADNYDRLWDLNPHEDEVSIGKIEKVQKRPKKATIRALTVDLNLFQENLPFNNTKNPKRNPLKIPKLPGNIYRDLLKRIMKTCQIYLDSLPEQRNSVTVDSRFNYVKKRIDPLTLEEEEEFSSHINHFYSFIKKKGFNITKETIQKMFKEGKNGAILRDIYFDFIETDNRDRLFFTSPDEDETEIGKIQKGKKILRVKLNNYLTSNIKKLQLLSEDFREINKEDEKKTDNTNKLKSSYVYTFVLRRVVGTCLTYLNSSLEERNSVDVNSRFYYVKQSLDKLSYDDNERFKEYLNRASKLNFLDKKISKHDHRIPLQNLEKFLKDEKNGPILENLLYEFVTKDNRDLVWALNPEEDEIEIGKIQKIKKRPKKNILDGFTSHLRKIQRNIKKLKIK